MKLSFATLISILLLGLGLILMISAIRPFTTNFGLILLVLGVIGILLSLVLGRNAKDKKAK